MEIILGSIMGVSFLLILVVGKIQAKHHKQDTCFRGSTTDIILNIVICLLFLMIVGCFFYPITDTWLDFIICLTLVVLSSILLYLYIGSNVEQKWYDIILFPAMVMMFFGFNRIIEYLVLKNIPNYIIGGLIGCMIAGRFKKSKYRIYKFIISMILIAICITLSPINSKYSKPYRYAKDYVLQKGFIIDQDLSIMISRKRVRFHPIRIHVTILNKHNIEMSTLIKLVYYENEIREETGSEDLQVIAE